MTTLIDKIILALETQQQHDWPDLQFSMHEYNCGTYACIAGWAIFAQDGYINSSRNIHHYAQELLGLDDDQANDLFLNWGDIEDPTPNQAIKVLKHLKETGEVDWSIVE
jgi:hypothetical protein